MISGGIISCNIYCNDILADNYFGSSKVFSWGFNRYGQLGIGSENNEEIPRYIEGLSGVKYISCGSEQTACIDNDGKLYTFGRGADARLGHGKTGGLNETYPRIVDELSDEVIIQVDAGYNHMGCVTINGDVFTFGKNTYNQLGHNNKSYPDIVKTLKDNNIKCTKISCGRYHSVVLSDDGKCYGFGGRKYGETGISNKNIPIPTYVSGLKGKYIIDIECGNDFTLFLTKNGEVYSSGANDQGQLGLGALRDRSICIPTKIRELKNVKHIAAGQFHCICLCENGSIYTWGLNKDGQLGHGDTQNRTKPTILMELNNDNLKPISVHAGGGHTGVVVFNKELNKKQLYIFGRGRQGQVFNIFIIYCLNFHKNYYTNMYKYIDWTCKSDRICCHV